jgi:hypothetical protein
MNDNFLDLAATNVAVPYVESFSIVLECSVCLGPHDEETHAATLSVRRWFRDEVTKSFRVQPLV